MFSGFPVNNFNMENTIFYKFYKLIFYKAEPGQIKFAKMGRPETLYVLLLLIDMLFVLFSKAIFSKTVGEGDVSNISSFCVFSENFSVAFIFKT